MSYQNIDKMISKIGLLTSIGLRLKVKFFEIWILVFGVLVFGVLVEV